MQDFYRCDDGFVAEAAAQAKQAAAKLVKDMHYEARVQSVIDFWKEKGIKYSKEEARTIYLTRDQYLSVNIEL